MPPEQDASASLATFDPPLAQAVVMVLRREGVVSRVQSSPGGEAEVLVPATRREEALSLLAAHMEDLHELARSEAVVPLEPPEAAPAEPEDDDEGPTRPIVMERLRRSGLGIAAVLVPLLVITLAAPDLPLRYALLVFVGGLVAITAWRRRSES
jgi:hypothetical protein